LCLFVASREVCTANPEYQQQQQWQIYIGHAPHHALCLWKPYFNGGMMIPEANGEIIIHAPPVGSY
jgi:hypothetical protein